MISTDQVCAVLARLASNVDSPRGLAVRLMADAHEWQQLQKLPAVAPGDYSDPERYALDACVTDFARKSPPLEGDLHQSALDTFWHCERQNAATNTRLSRFIHNQGPFSPADMRVIPFITVWRKKISRVLGTLPGKIVPRFSPGATVSNKGVKITIPDKLSTTPTLYPQTQCLAPFIERTAWGRCYTAPPITVRHNEFFSVPKDATKNRGCCKEASGSVALQLAVGTHVRRRLMKFGIDLDQGQDIHRELARKGSIHGRLVTVDLSNASDTIARKLVQLLLPEEWYLLLNSLRASFTLVDGKSVRLEKFSSMGNGFTFELETLIFWTLAETCLEVSNTFGQSFCYGDDIIFPNDPEAVSTLMGAFSYFGFTPNEKKTFVSGPFRESCGGDFFNGVRVRPHYQKNYLDEPQDWIALINGLKRIDRPSFTGEARRYALTQLPSAIARLRGPSSLGDIVIHDEDPNRWRLRKLPHGWEGFEILGYTPVPRTTPLSRWAPQVAYSAALYGVPSGGVVRRGHVKGHKMSWIVLAFEDTPGRQTTV